MARRAGYHLVRADYYSPIPDVDQLPSSTWEGPAVMPGVNLRIDDGLALLEGELSSYVAEYSPPAHPPGTAHGYHTANPMYGSVDGEILYAMVRQVRPTRVVEIGAGWSSLVIADAAVRNAAEGHPMNHRVFDPHPSPLVARLPSHVAVSAQGALDIPDEHFDDLTAGDILFIDTTHTVKPGGDVVRLLLEVLPKVAPGVVVHVHDFFRPFEYPRELFERFHVYWQEQYLLQAFLAFNDCYEVLMANHALVRTHRERVMALIPGLEPAAMPSGLWLRRLG